MTRTSKSRGAKPFNMRSTNKTSFKNMASKLPDGRPKSSVFQKDKKVFAIEDYQSGMDKINAAIKNGATKEQVREMVKTHNKANMGKKYKKGAIMNSRIRFDQIKFGNGNQNVEKSTTTTDKTLNQTSNKTSNTKEENRDYDVYAVSSEDQKRITEKYGMGPDPTGNREKDLKIAAEKYANRNYGY